MEKFAFELEQNGERMYLTWMKAEELMDTEKVKVDIWGRANTDGYQRTHTVNRSNAFGRFIAVSKGISPLSVLLSVRGPVDFKREKGNFGTLVIPDIEPLWIVDGQHRIWGLREAVGKSSAYEPFPLPVVILQRTDKKDEVKEKGQERARYEEAKQFVIINRTQKGVRTDLADQFLSRLLKHEGTAPAAIAGMPSRITAGIEWIPRALKITELLNASDGPWKDKVHFPGEPKKGTAISQGSLKESLEPILKHESFQGYSEEEVAEMLRRYWGVLYELCPAAVDDPQDYLIQRTIGVGALHKLFPIVAAFTGGELTQQRIKEVLKKTDFGMTSEFWDSKHGEAGLIGTGKKAVNMLWGRLRDALETGNQEVLTPARPFRL
jgi:DGQHR domain-containing protein